MTSDSPQENLETKSVGLSNATDRYLPKTSDASQTDDIDDLKARSSEARKDRNNWVAA